MIYVEKDFYFNFAEASQDANPERLRKVVLAEIVELIKKNKKGLVGLMNRTGVQISTNASDKDLVTLLVHNLTGNNQRLIRGVAELIEAQQSAIGEKNPNAIPLVANGIGATFSLFGRDKEANNIKELLQILNGTNSGKALSVDASTNTTGKSAKTIYWAIGIVAVLIGVGVYLNHKHKNKSA